MSLASELVCLSVPTASLLLLLLLGWLNLSDPSPDGTERSAAQEEGRLGESKSHGSVSGTVFASGCISLAPQ